MLNEPAPVRPEARFSSSLRSPLPGVALPAWQRFVAALELEQQPGGALRPRRMDAVSARAGFGSYDLRPRRLQELGYVTALKREGGAARHRRRHLYTCTFLPPWTAKRFLADPAAQLEALSRSMAGYLQDLEAGRLVRPAGCSLAGALAILHCGGRGALAKYPALFPHTRAVYERAQGAF